MPPGNSLYIPKDLQARDLQDPESRWSYYRMDYTDNFVIFREKGGGNDLSSLLPLEGRPMQVNPGNPKKNSNTFTGFSGMRRNFRIRVSGSEPLYF